MKSQYLFKTLQNLQPTQIPLKGREITNKKNIGRHINFENQQSLQQVNIGEILHQFVQICSEIQLDEDDEQEEKIE